MQNQFFGVPFAARPITAAAMLLALSTAAFAADYQSTVLSDSPLAYYRLGETPAASDVAKNLGSLGAAGNGTYRHDNANQTTMHRVTGALAGNGNAAAGF